MVSAAARATSAGSVVGSASLVILLRVKNDAATFTAT